MRILKIFEAFPVSGVYIDTYLGAVYYDLEMVNKVLSVYGAREINDEVLQLPEVKHFESYLERLNPLVENFIDLEKVYITVTLAFKIATIVLPVDYSAEILLSTIISLQVPMGVGPQFLCNEQNFSEEPCGGEDEEEDFKK